MKVQTVIDDQVNYEETLGERLVEAGRIDPPSLDRAKRIRAESGEPLVTLLPKLGLVSERDLAEAVAQALDLPMIGPDEFPETALYQDKLSPRFLQEAQVLPVAEAPEGLIVAMVDPLNDYAADAMRLVSGRELVRRVRRATSASSSMSSGSRTWPARRRSSVWSSR
jgi:general secretion pathway protein E